MQRAVDYARQRKGPAFVHAHVIRPYSHSLSDDEVMYRPPEERDADAARDPLTTFPAWLRRRRVTPPRRSSRRSARRTTPRRARGDRRGARAPSSRAPRPSSASSIRPTSTRRASSSTPRTTRSSRATPTTMVDLLNACMRDEMRRDPSILVFGEDVADVSREKYLGKVKGKGGVFKVTWGLQKEFGGVARLQLAAGRGEHRRARDRPGAARLQAGGRESSSSTTSGRRTCRSATSWRRCAGARNGDFSAPVVIRTTYGGYLRGAVYHSQTGASLFTHTPGAPRRLSVDRARRERAAAHGDPLRRSGALPRAQASLPADVQQGRVSRRRTS